MYTYNPLKNAVAAAWTELTTPDAIQWYQDRAWSDTLTTAAAFNRACFATIQLGMFCRCLVEDWLNPATSSATTEYLALNPAPCAGYLPAAQEDAANSTPAPLAVIDYGDLTVLELREICTSRGLRWRKAHRGRHLTKVQMLQLLRG